MDREQVNLAHMKRGRTLLIEFLESELEEVGDQMDADLKFAIFELLLELRGE
jgi:hypothetical protein